MLMASASEQEEDLLRDQEMRGNSKIRKSIQANVRLHCAQAGSSCFGGSGRAGGAGVGGAAILGTVLAGFLSGLF